VIFLIPARDPPRLAEPQKWSKDFNDFISTCLQKNPQSRPSSRELLQVHHTILTPIDTNKHPFVQRGMKNTTSLKNLVQDCLPELAKLRERKKARDGSDSDGERDVCNMIGDLSNEYLQSRSSSLFGPGTTIKINTTTGAVTMSTAYGTTVVAESEDEDEEDYNTTGYNTTEFN
jgi:serine/threonine protein kinase